MDQIKDKIEDIVKKVMKDKDFAKDFTKNPVKAIEKVLGVNLPDDQINAIIKGVKEKVSLDSIGGLLDSDGDGKPDLGGIGKLGSLLKK